MFSGRTAWRCPPVNVSAALFRFVLSGIVAILAWAYLHVPTERALRDVSAAIARLSGAEPLVAGSPGLPPPGLREGQIGIAFRTPAGQQQLYGIDLMRWHANLIVLPPLAIGIGRLGMAQRALILLAGLPLLLILDAASAFFYLVLATRRLSGNPLCSVAIDRNIEYGIAVVGLKILPLVVWGLLYAAVRKMVPPSSVAGSPPPVGCRGE